MFKARSKPDVWETKRGIRFHFLLLCCPFRSRKTDAAPLGAEDAFKARVVIDPPARRIHRRYRPERIIEA